MKVFQDIHAFSDSMDLCKFSAFAMGMDEYAAQYAAMTGVEFSVDDGLIAGERIYNLERYYNNLAGHGEGSDYLPKRFTEEASTMPGSEGHVCEIDLMLVDYYAAARLGKRRCAGSEAEGAGDYCVSRGCGWGLETE